jgi:hypothetical protein
MMNPYLFDPAGAHTLAAFARPRTGTRPSDASGPVVGNGWSSPRQDPVLFRLRGTLSGVWFAVSRALAEWRRSRVSACPGSCAC